MCTCTHAHFMHMQPANIHWLTFTCCTQRYFSEIPDKIILWSITVHAQQCKWHAPVLYHERTKQFHHLSDIWRALKVLHSYHLSFNFGLVGQIKQLSSNIWKLDDANKKKSPHSYFTKTQRKNVPDLEDITKRCWLLRNTSPCETGPDAWKMAAL